MFDHFHRTRASAWLVGLAALIGAAGVQAKTAIVPTQVTAAPTVTVIDGDPLQVHVGSDNSFQIFNSQVPGSGQVYPTNATDTADMGWFVRTADTLYAPDFSEHPSGTATGGIGAYTAVTPGVLSGVSGSGSAADPFRVTVTSTLGASGITATQQVLYVNGQNYFTKVFTLTNGGATQDLTIFLGADIYLAASDAGVPFLEPTSTSPGGQNCGKGAETYTILLIPQTPADAYSARGYGTIWSEIGADALDDIVDANCEDNGAALQWNRTLAAGASLTIQAATSFGEIPSITQFNVSSVSPPSGAAGTSVGVTITGIGFEAGTTFDFGAGVTVTNLAIVDANTATATLVINAAAATGPRDVVGSQSTGGLTATLADGFTVTGGTLPPPVTAVPTPTLGTWALVVLMLTIAASAVVLLRRAG
ncbi:MAG TPA: hypothetical protein VGC30_08505 [Dokdonella sp.]